jgi:hypothetical protein
MAQQIRTATDTGSSGDLVFFLFDLLHLDGIDTRPLPLLDGKAKLAELLIGVIAFGVALYFYASQQSLPCLRAKLLTLLRRAFTGLAAFLSIRRRGQRHRWRSAIGLRDHIAAERQLCHRLTRLDRARHQQCSKGHIHRHLRPPSMCHCAG